MYKDNPTACYDMNAKPIFPPKSLQPVTSVPAKATAFDLLTNGNQTQGVAEIQKATFLPGKLGGGNRGPRPGR
jgi:hypothetical protein